MGVFWLWQYFIVKNIISFYHKHGPLKCVRTANMVCVYFVFDFFCYVRLTSEITSESKRKHDYNKGKSMLNVKIKLCKSLKKFAKECISI